MGIDLGNKNGNSFRFRHNAWARLLNLAEDYGWQPQGTELDDCYPEEDRGNWGGGYSSNDLQIVNANDAANLADAVERVLAEIPEERRRVSRRKEVYSIEELSRISAEGFFRGGQERIRRAIEFFREGAFQIY